MRTASLGPLGEVSRITLGGAGVGAVFGPTSPEEAVATVRAAVDAGVSLLDTAPIYRHCEAMIARAFEGAPPNTVRVTSKCLLGTVAAGDVAMRLESSLAASAKAMRLERIDAFFLHSNIFPDGYVYARSQEHRDWFATPWSLYTEHVVPALEALKASGRIAAWGITGVGVPAAVRAALAAAAKPDLVQVVSNLMDSPGSLKRYAEPAEPREIIAAAVRGGVAVMGIRAPAGGALTLAMDRQVAAEDDDGLDWRRAAPFRALAAAWGADPALLAHRYALGMAGVATVVIGAKNRSELAQCLEAETLGPLPPELVAPIDALGLRPSGPLAGRPRKSADDADYADERRSYAVIGAAMEAPRSLPYRCARLEYKRLVFSSHLRTSAPSAEKTS